MPARWETGHASESEHVPCANCSLMTFAYDNTSPILSMAATFEFGNQRA